MQAQSLPKQKDLKSDENHVVMSVKHEAEQALSNAQEEVRAIERHYENEVAVSKKEKEQVGTKLQEVMH